MENPTTVTQSGRISKPPDRLGITIDDLRRKENQDLKQAIEQSMLDSRKAAAKTSVRQGGSLKSSGQVRERSEPRPGPSGTQAAPSSKGGSKATVKARSGSLRSEMKVGERREPQPGPSGTQASSSKGRGAAKEADSSEDSLIGILKK